MKCYKDQIKKHFNSSIDIKLNLLNSEGVISSINNLVETISNSLSSGGKVIFCGNGGSFADAQHLSAEFTSRFMFDRPSLPSLALGTNSSAMSAIANDYGYDQVFSRELESIGCDTDILIAITTSGLSPNVIRVLEAADRLGIFSVLLTGNRQGLAKKFPNTTLIQVPSSETALIQESHISIGHILCGLVELKIFGDNKP